MGVTRFVFDDPMEMASAIHDRKHWICVFSSQRLGQLEIVINLLRIRFGDQVQANRIIWQESIGSPPVTFHAVFIAKAMLARNDFDLMLTIMNWPSGKVQTTDEQQFVLVCPSAELAMAEDMLRQIETGGAKPHSIENN